MKKYIIALIILMSTTSVFAQSKQEVGGYLSGGVSAMTFKGAEKRVNDKMGFAAGFSYQYFLTENWGVKSGLEIANYNSKIFVDNISASVASVDDEGETFDYRYSVGGYKEKQYAYLLNIPLMINYTTTDLTPTTNLYASLGVKLGIPVSARYQSDISSIQTQGYYPSTNATYDDLTFRGFGVFSDLRTKDKIANKFQVIGSAEVGLKNQVGENLYVYTGIYFDYGLTSFASHDKTFISYNRENPKVIQNQSVLNSQYIKEGVQNKMVKNTHIMAIGLKVNIAFEL